MERRFIVIKEDQSQGPRTRSLAPGSGLGTRGTSGPAILEVHTLRDRDARDLSRKEDVRAVVPEIPLRLVRPASLSGTALVDPVVGGTTWGIRAVGATDTPFTGKGVKVAVLDTGIDGKHDAFRNVELTESDYTGEGNGDKDGHGTHCAATIFGRDVAGVRVGVAPGITQAFIGKVIGQQGGGTSALVRAIREALEAGCQIVSMSLGFDFPGAVARLQEQGGLPPDLAAARALYEYRANVRLFDSLGDLVRVQRFGTSPEPLLLAASGNESRRDVNPQYEMPAAPPSEADGFTAVGAVGPGRGEKLAAAPFSNTACVLCAPGVGILSARAGTKSELVAFNGTSMATPHAAGIAALFAERQASQPQSQSVFGPRTSLLTRILNGASLAPLEPDVDPAHVGYGLIRAPRAD